MFFSVLEGFNQVADTNQLVQSSLRGNAPEDSSSLIDLFTNLGQSQAVVNQVSGHACMLMGQEFKPEPQQTAEDLQADLERLIQILQNGEP